MPYPKKPIDFGDRTVYVEMTPEEYEAELQWYRNQIPILKTLLNPGDMEYYAYLTRWFGDGWCDGIESFAVRKRLHTLPMPQTMFLFG